LQSFGQIETKMLKLLVLSFVVVYVYAAYYEDSTEYWINKVNSKKLPWKAGYNKYLSGWSKEQMKRLMGTKMDRRGLAQAPKQYHTVNLASLPTQFTSGVDKWQTCNSTIQYIKDQADCGSCWAVAASEVAADRTCIANMASMPHHNSFLNEPAPVVALSAEQLMSCCKYCGDGCNGGYPIDAMKFWSFTGLVTGGWYGSNCGCQPYMIPPCGPQGCSSPEATTPTCSTTCRKGFTGTMKTDTHKAKTYYQIGGTAAQIQQEIYTNGPVECAFTVYNNFMSYTGGVYNETAGDELGGHAVKIIGWGHDQASGLDYWLINNSWNVTWGINGQFKFKRGVDLAGMEEQCVAGMAVTGQTNIKLTC
jgi:cathepsin B